MTASLAIEAAFTILLVVTIGYAFVLNRRLEALRGNQQELAQLIHGLNQAAARAQESIYELRTVSQTAEETLKREISRARALSDELALITEAGGNLAQKIERGLLRRRGAGESNSAAEPVSLRNGAAQRAPTARSAPKLWDLEEKTDEDIRTALRAAR